ncbi:anti-sigma factor [Nocardia sp. NPDC048505]|uniref:anti-sigma factor n=1 Tax=Nocardia sp. NPDC048505 TaxID=3155756 RepID=UPI0033DBD1F5
MPDIHPHDELLDLAYPYALDALTDAERKAVEHMLAHADEETAAAFRATVRDVAETLVDLTAVDAVPAPPNVEAALLRAIGVPEKPARNRLRWLAVAAAIVAAIALGAGIAVVRNDSGAPGLTAQQVLTHEDTRSASAAVAGGGTMTVSTSRELGAATVAFEAVPATPPDRTYQMWLIGPDGNPRSAGVLATLPTGNAPMLVRTDNADKVAMSIEPAGGSPAPTDARVIAPLG